MTREAIPGAREAIPGVREAVPGVGEVVLGADDVAAVLALAADAEAHDGVAPLSEEFLLALREPGRPQLLARAAAPAGAGTGAAEAPGPIVGAAVRAAGDAVEIVVAPAHRRRGHATALLAASEAGVPGSRYWAHGDLPGARGLAAAAGLEPVRELLKLGVDLVANPPADAPDAPDAGAPGASDAVVIVPLTRADDAERHLDDWLTLNALAFADHPEQGRWTWDDLVARTREPWMDPALLWVAYTGDADSADPEKPSTAVGSVWVKAEAGAEAEIYVLAVHPDAAGRGIGRLLLTHALREVASRGGRAVELYVDGGNTAAVRLYERAGFTVVNRDVQYVTTSRHGLEGVTIGT